MSIAVGLITGGDVRWETTWSLVKAARAGAFDDFRIVPNTCMLDDGRNHLVRWFLEETGCDKFLSLDADISFLPSDLAQLDDDDLDCVAGVYYNVFEGELKPVVRMLDDTPIIDDPVMEVRAVGAGFLLVARPLLEKMAGEYAEPLPWFYEPVLEGLHVGEDFGFCHRVREMGEAVHIDLRVQLNHHKTVRIAPPRLVDYLNR